MGLVKLRRFQSEMPPEKEDRKVSAFILFLKYPATSLWSKWFRLATWVIPFFHINIHYILHIASAKSSQDM